MKKGSKYDDIIKLVFMILAIITVICLFMPSVSHSVAMTVGGIAVILRIVQYILRYFN